MKNGFLKHFAVIGVSTVLNLLIGLLTTPIITRLVNPIEFGQLSVFTMYGNIGVMVLCIGLDQSLTRFYYEEDTIKGKQSLLKKCITLPIVAISIVSLVLIKASYMNWIQFEFNTTIIILLCLYVFILIVLRFSLLLVRLGYKSKQYAYINIIQKISYVIIALLLLNFNSGKDFLMLVYATVMASAICMVVSIEIQKDIWNRELVVVRGCKTSCKDLLTYAYPFIFSMGITTLFQAIDKLSLNYYCTYAEVGVYSSAMTLVHVFAVIQTTFNTLWAPMAIEHYSKDNEDRTFYQQGNAIITVIMFAVGLTLILGKDIFAILLGEKYREAAYILPFLIFNPIMYTISETTVGGLVFMKKSKLQIVVAAGSCLTNIIGNIILVPQLGCQGAAISTGISYIVFFSLRTVLANKYFYVDFKLVKFYLLTTMVSLYAYYNTFVKFNFISVLGYILSMLLMIVLYNKVICFCVKYCLCSVKETWNKKKETINSKI